MKKAYVKNNQNTVFELKSDDSNECTIIENKIDESTGIENELENLRGSKCQAPFDNGYGSKSYHNALVMSVQIIDTTNSQSLDNIMVTVLYTNPTCNQMLPCQFFLNGECKYSKEQCYFSHGTKVPLSSLTEFKEPNFEKLKKGSLVLAKTSEGIWARAIILDLVHSTSTNDGICVVRYETKSFGETEVSMQNIYPLEGTDDGDIHESSSDSDDGSNIKMRDSAIVNNVLLSSQPIEALGSWEKHTKGIGSKLMTKMGYIMGAGLGKNGEGRIEPVEAIVLPKGKSLDHCMVAKNSSKVRDLQKKRKKQMNIERCMKKSYEKASHKPQDIFTFLNSRLNNQKISKDLQVVDEKKIKLSTTHDLNVRSLKIEEDIKRQQLVINELNYKLKNSSLDSTQRNMVNQKLNEANSNLKKLQAEEKSIKKEHKHRETHKKMTTF
ncbi:zinc finger CCCH-type with G patch domain-containing protein isoform X2 [Daktulosphaira vitifoliae]|uniref:zinc finger CCCH-type with G patch domain-containing protein isoform X2 n=1 Tax=Daktulosphaira vitifoliae TaxID=58002 RepID=UPI0021AABBF0|nr:zinc finger CCCH-type with G patch domain-containing protein isoform X2 [Daktulosphaira vitifoliae]